MTDEMMNLRALVEKTPDADLLREMIGFAAQRLMELEVEGLAGTGYGEKSHERLVRRNGYRDRDWETRAGTVELRYPQAAQGQLLPGLPGGYDAGGATPFCSVVMASSKSPRGALRHPDRSAPRLGL
jgi:transposase-like protein